MSSETIPDWAMEEAVAFEKDLPTKITGANRVFIRAVLARALLDAERRGLERATPALAKAEQALKDWLHVYAPDLCKPEEVEAAENRIGEHGTIAYIADALAAIRSLGEKT